jgi:hypothetical protein
MTYKNIIQDSWYITVIWIPLFILLFAISSWFSIFTLFIIATAIIVTVLGYLVKNSFFLEFQKHALYLPKTFKTKHELEYQNIESYVIRQGPLNKWFNTYDLSIFLNYYPEGEFYGRTSINVPGLSRNVIIVPFIERRHLDQIVKELIKHNPTIQSYEFKSNYIFYLLQMLFIIFLVCSIPLFILIFTYIRR